VKFDDGGLNSRDPVAKPREVLGAWRRPGQLRSRERLCKVLDDGRQIMNLLEKSARKVLLDCPQGDVGKNASRNEGKENGRHRNPQEWFDAQARPPHGDGFLLGSMPRSR
jgi:hypothetical protein